MKPTFPPKPSSARLHIPASAVNGLASTPTSFSETKPTIYAACESARTISDPKTHCLNQAGCGSHAGAEAIVAAFGGKARACILLPASGIADAIPSRSRLGDCPGLRGGTLSPRMSDPIPPAPNPSPAGKLPGTPARFAPTPAKYLWAAGLVFVLVAIVAGVGVLGAVRFATKKARALVASLPTPAPAQPSKRRLPNQTPTRLPAIKPAVAPTESALYREGAFGFPQREAAVLCNRADLRFSVWTSREILYAQAIMWNDGDASPGRTNDGREIGDTSVLMLGLGAHGSATPDVDRNYSLSPWPNLPGLRYSVRKLGGSTPIKSDTAGRGAIRYETVSAGRKARVDSFLIPLAEISKQVGDRISLAYWGKSPQPPATVNSTDFSPGAAHYSFSIPLPKYHGITLGPGHAFDVNQVPAEKKDAPTASTSAVPTGKGPALGELVEIKFTAIDGRQVDLAKMRGKVVLIDFWATWCGPCIAELPHVIETYGKYHDKGFEIIGISFDSDRAALVRMTAAKQMSWPQFFDGKGWKNAFGTRFGIRAIPTMWLVNKQGKLVSVNARADLAGQVGKLLAE
ncbi:MAG: TlpA disulfide reductase family protein [Chthoniobacteraceae bacterium]